MRSEIMRGWVVGRERGGEKGRESWDMFWSSLHHTTTSWAALSCRVKYEREDSQIFSCTVGLWEIIRYNFINHVVWLFEACTTPPAELHLSCRLKYMREHSAELDSFSGVWFHFTWIWTPNSELQSASYSQDTCFDFNSFGHVWYQPAVLLTFQWLLLLYLLDFRHQLLDFAHFVCFSILLTCDRFVNQPAVKKSNPWWCLVSAGPNEL